jgi:invasion protein IalB
MPVLQKEYFEPMIRVHLFLLPAALALVGGLSAMTPAVAVKAHKPAQNDEAKDPANSKTKPVQVATYGDWGAFVAQVGEEKTCYALAKPKDRAPATLKRDPAFIFISSRPSENIRNEVSIIMGFPMKDGGDAEADIGDVNFELISKGKDAWVKNPAKESELIGAMKKGATLTVKASSIHGNMTTDSYSLSGLSQALDRVAKECR